MPIQACDVDADRLLAYLLDPAKDAEFPTHVAGCSFCQVRLLQMGAAAMKSDTERKACSEYVPHLAEFVVAEAEQIGETQQFVALQEHLVLCEECFALYKELRFMEQLVANGALATPPRSSYRAPDLSFLQPAFEWVKTRMEAEGINLIRTLHLKLSALFQNNQLVLGATRGTVSSEPEVLEVDREQSEEDGTPLAGIVLGAETLGELDVDLKLYPDTGDPSFARLEVRALAIERFTAGFGGTRIILRLVGKKEIVRETNEEGVVIFERLLREEVRTATLEITPAG
jgi:hypothetical protein